MPTMDHEERVAYRMDIWDRWIDKTVPADEGWYKGWCPIDDRRCATLWSGEYNFRNGTFRCLSTPRCHDKRGISLSQLADMVVQYVP